ncbi:cytochrome p450 55a3, partial [Colletotrichum incanum]
LAMKRAAKEDIDLGSKIIKAGEGIIASTQLGNRDEDIFPDPDVFDMHRTLDPNHALGFGLDRTATLFRKALNPRIAVPISDIEYTPLQKDIGGVKLPVQW